MLWVHRYKPILNHIKSVDVYHAEKANQLMTPGDPEPPHLYKASVLHVAKNEFIKSQHFDEDPIKALCIMKYSAYLNCIHNIGIDPFFVHYWTNHQLQIYRKYCSTNISSVYIDATGSIVKKIIKVNETLSKHIFLYQAVINYDGHQFPVTQMLSERHTTNNIHFWLLEWSRMGAPYPREVVVDSSKALLNAVVRCFTSHATIKDYANACKNKIMPECYIRIDVAHCIKMYANFLKNLPRRIKIFYMAAIGQLIMCQNIDNAAIIFRAILTVALSETEGTLANGEETPCEKEKKRLKSIVTGISEYENIEDTIEKVIADEDEIEELDNEWLAWSMKINVEVENVLHEVGDRDNAHYFPPLAKRLLKDMTVFPLWSNVCRNDFGYGRIPASSAAVEGEFNKLKNNVLKNLNLPIRVDEFIKIHLDFLHGKLKIVDAKKDSLTQQLCDEMIIDENNKDKKTSNVDASRQILLKSCPACANNDLPSGAHICVICKTAVHALEQCSTSINEEGQKRICLFCSSHKSSHKILASQEMENWRGLNDEENTKSKSKYLVKSHHVIQDSLTWSKSTRLPIIKNGSTMELQAIKLNDQNYCLRNTCAFDSLLQIVLVALADYEHFQNKIREKNNNNNMYQMGIDILDKGISGYTYKLRAQILIPIFTSQNVESEDCSQQVNCQTNAGYLANIIFKDTPSFEEMSVCNMGCPQRVKKLPVAQIDRNMLFKNDFFNVINNSVILKGQKKCYRKDCPGFETTTLSKIGFLVLFDICTLENTSKPIKVQDIPSVIENPLNTEKHFELLGIIEFKMPPRLRCGSSQKIGHYTAICLRTGNFIEYNDLLTTEKKLRKSIEVNPHVLVYIQKETK